MHMKTIKHTKIPVNNDGWIDESKCQCGDMYAHYLWMAAPEIDWYYVESVGDYQGIVFAIGKYNNQWFVMKDYYGSCSYCGAWGEGGEPEGLKDVLEHGELFDSPKQAREFVLQTWSKSYAEQPTDKFYTILR